MTIKKNAEPADSDGLLSVRILSLNLPLVKLDKR